MHARALILSAAAAMALATLAAPRSAHAQGALRPVEAMIVNPANRPVPVTVLNTPTQASEGSYELYNMAVSATAGLCSPDPLTVPAGKRLVLRHVGARALLTSPGALTDVSIVRVTNGALSGLVLILPAAAPLATSGGFISSTAGQQVHAYIDGAFTFCTGMTAPTGGTVVVSFHGYLVAKP